LPSIKRFKVGGNRIGRGFEAAAASGDRGLGTKVELRRRLSDASGPLGSGAVYGYYDLGTAWKDDPGGRESAASGGIGFAMRGEQLSGYLEIAKPLTHVDADGTKDVGLFAELSFQF
jgi:hemolysin activation/secretion protein